MDKREIVERLKNIAEHAVHTAGEEPFVMSLDDGIAVHEAIELLKKPETNCSEIPNNSDTISRQAVTKFLNDWLSCLFENCHKQSASDLKMIIKDFKNLPSAQPEQHLDEWCVDCKEYDKEKHSCPRWNRVIRQTLLDAQPEHKTGHWILDRSGAYCCSKCMEPCAGYIMMKPRDKFCKMCGSRNEVEAETGRWNDEMGSRRERLFLQ